MIDMGETKNNWIRQSKQGIELYTVLSILFLTLICTVLKGQDTPKIDSLNNLLTNHKEEDTIRLRRLVELSRHYINIDAEKGLDFGKQAIQLSDQLVHKKMNASAHYLVAQNHDQADQYDLALEYYEKAASLFDTLEMKKDLGYCYAKMSVLHRNTGEYEEAMAYVVKAKEINETRGDLVHLGYNLNNMGTISNDLGQLDQAMDYFKQALEIRKELKDTLTSSQSLLNMATVLIGHGKYDKAMEYSYEALANFEHLRDTLSIGESIYLIGSIKALNYKFVEARKDLKKALLMFEVVDEKFMIVPTLTMIGGCLAETEDFEEAIAKYKEALSIAEQFNYTADVALILTNLANCHAKLAQYKAALDYGNRALEIQKALNVPTAILSGLRTIAHVYLKMEDYDQAIIHSGEALSMLNDPNRYNDLALIHEVAYQAHQAKGNYKEAFNHLNRYMVAMDSLYNVQKDTEIANLTSVHDLKEQESENEVLRLNKELDETTIKKQNYLIIGSVLVIAVLAILIFIVYRGLVQRRRMSTHLSAMNNELNQTNEKLRALDNFRTRLFANINHDFRTPLTLIKGYTDQITKNKDNYLTRSTESDLANLQKNTSILTQMTGEIQNLLLLEEGKLVLTWSEIHLLPMLTLIVNMFDSKVVQEKKSLQLNTRINEDVILRADKLYFKKILFNLISNAIKHTRSGDTISVTSYVQNDQVILQVSDTGEGIDPAHLPYVFDRFYQAPDQPYANQEGFGIGLSLVKELVTLHGGQITAESIQGEGATFTVVLPFNLDKTTSETSDTADSEAFSAIPNSPEQSLNAFFPGQKEKTVLIVDDHEEIRSYIGSILNEDYNLTFAGHGQQALEVLAATQVDLIITDLMMPWLDGFELIDELSKNERLKNIPVLVVSARTSDIDKQKVLQAGVNDFILKPFEADDLRKRVKNRINDTANIKSNAWQIIASDKDLTSNVEQSITKKINQLIISRIDDPNLTVEDVANEINASRSKTFRLIKELTQKTPKAYIKDLRLEYVHELIKKGKIRNASEGARAVGMLNGTEFKNQYEARFGLIAFEA